MRLTGGTVEFMQRRNTGNYEHAEARLAFTWAIDEKDTQAHVLDWLEVMQETVRGAVRHQLYGTPKPALGPTHPKAVEAPQGQVKSDPKAETYGGNNEPGPVFAKEPVNPATIARASDEFEPDKTEAPKANGGQPAPKKAGRPKTKAKAEEKPAAVEDDPTMASAADVEDPDEDDPTKGEAGEISDDDLNGCIKAKALELKDNKPVRRLVGSYVGIGKASIEMPQEKRAAFLAELAALGK